MFCQYIIFNRLNNRDRIDERISIKKKDKTEIEKFYSWRLYT